VQRGWQGRAVAPVILHRPLSPLFGKLMPKLGIELSLHLSLRSFWPAEWERREEEEEEVISRASASVLRRT